MPPEARTTPYSTVTPYATSMPTWAGADDNERLAAYQTYQDMYWSEENAFQLIRRSEDGVGIYVPKPKMICDITAHYLLKGLTIGLADPEATGTEAEYLKAFLLREAFDAKFAVAKLAGVIRGDWVFHVTADPAQPEGSRVSMNSVDPASFFPEWDEDDLTKLVGVRLVEQFTIPESNGKTGVKILHYWYEGGAVWREENIWEMEGWNNPKKARKVKVLIPAGPLPSDIRVIPVYHFLNAEFDGFYFGNSELKGYERIFKAINQAVSDEELALALVGLGVYATDAGRPVNETTGEEEDWVVSPGKVWEMPGATMVKRLEGITTVTPVLDHVRYLEDSLLQASATSKAAIGEIDVQTAESGIALALKFAPTLAKIEYRDKAGIAKLYQMWYDLKSWFYVYDGFDMRTTEIIPRLGEKLPVNRSKTIEELNNMLDRKVISRKFYRQEVERVLGYNFPEEIEQDILDEETALREAQTLPAATDDPSRVSGPGGRLEGQGDTLGAGQQNRSNNRSRTNESNGTEANNS